MLTKKQIQARISAGMTAENAENAERREAVRGELVGTVALAQDALQKAGLVHTGWWHNDCGNGCGLSYLIRMSSVLPGQDVEICIRKGVCGGRSSIEVKRTNGEQVIAKNFFLGWTNQTEEERTREIEDFQLFTTLMVTDHFPNSKFSAIVFDARGNRRS